MTKMDYRLMNSSNRNPGTETFDRIQRWAVLPIILVAAVLAILRNQTSWVVLPIALAVGATYLLLVLGGTRAIRTAGSKFLKRDH